MINRAMARINGDVENIVLAEKIAVGWCDKQFGLYDYQSLTMFDKTILVNYITRIQT